MLTSSSLSAAGCCERSFFLFLAVSEAVVLQREFQKGRRGVQKTQNSKVLSWEYVYIKVEQLNKQPSAWFGGEKGSLQEWIGILLACICRDMHIISGLCPWPFFCLKAVPLRPKSVRSIIKYYKILPWIINCSSEVIPFWKGAWGSPLSELYESHHCALSSFETHGLDRAHAVASPARDSGR